MANLTIQLTIAEDVLEDILRELNDDFDAGDPFCFSRRQLERAFVAYFEAQAEEAGAVFWDKVKRGLGDPEHDMRQAQLEARADLAHEKRNA